MISRQAAVAQVVVTDRHSAEGLHHVGLRPGDVVVTDAGYPLGKSVQQELAQGASFNSRFFHEAASMAG